jgi:methionyl-tRNA synthetase
VLKTPSTSSSSCPTRAAWSFLEEWTQDGRLQPEVANKIKEWFSVRTNPDGSTSEGLGDWDISRDAPYFGIEIPDAPGKYFYVWLDAPIGYLASLKNLLTKRGEDYDAYMADPALEQYHFIGKDIVTFHTLFWPAMLNFSGRKVPDNVFVHGFLTVNNGEKMSKSRGTGLDPLKYLEPGHEPRVAALLPGRQAQQPQRRHRLQRRRLHGARQQRPDRQVRQHRQPRGRLSSAKRFGGKLGKTLSRPTATRCWTTCAPCRATIAELLRAEREYGKALRETMLLADRVNAYVDQNKPWELAKQPAWNAACTTCAPPASKAFRLLTILPQARAAGAGRAGRGLPEGGALTFAARTRWALGHVIGEYST